MGNPPAVDASWSDFRRSLLAAGFTLGQGKEERWECTQPIEWRDKNSGEWQSAEHRIAILLPTGFPYHAPSVYSNDVPALKPSWHLAPSGCLCLWREPGGWNPFTSAQKLLHRIQEWFIHYHQDDWPDDFAPTDLHLYLSNEGIVVIGEEWQPSLEQDEGEFFLSRNAKFPNQPCLVALRTDKKQQGTQEQRLLNVLHWDSNGASRYRGVWFRVDTPFVPGGHLTELCEQIDQSRNRAPGASLNFIVSLFGRTPSCKGIPIAVGYPGVQKQERWLFLWAVKPAGKRFHLQNDEQQKVIEIRSFETAPARKSDLLRRTITTSQSLEGKKIALFGVGALGGTVATLLAKAGIGELRLVDSDLVRPTNAIRHEVGIAWIGMKKTLAVRSRVNQHNPDCTVNTFEETWLEDDLRKIINEADLIIDTTANKPFSLWLNQLAVAEKKSILFAAAYRRAAVGRLILLRAGGKLHDPCLACYLLADKYWNEDQYPIIPPDSNGFFEEEGCASVTEEADAISLGSIANLTAKTAYKFLSGKLDDGANLYFQVNDPLTAEGNLLSRSGLHKVGNSAADNCPICGI